MARYKKIENFESYLRENAGKISAREMAENLDYSVHHLRTAANKLGISVKIRSRIERKEELEKTILENGSNMTATEISEKFGVAVGTVRYTAWHLNVRLKPSGNKKQTKERQPEPKEGYYRDSMYEMMMPTLI